MAEPLDHGGAENATLFGSAFFSIFLRCGIASRFPNATLTRVPMMFTGRNQTGIDSPDTIRKGETMHYFTLTVKKTVYSCLTIVEAKTLQARIGGKIEHQFTN
jgi:hypothetical protein